MEKTAEKNRGLLNLITPMAAPARIATRSVAGGDSTDIYRDAPTYIRAFSKKHLRSAD